MSELLFGLLYTIVNGDWSEWTLPRIRWRIILHLTSYGVHFANEEYDSEKKIEKINQATIETSSRTVSEFV